MCRYGEGTCSMPPPHGAIALRLFSSSVTGHRFTRYHGYDEFNPPSWPSTCAPDKDAWVIYQGDNREEDYPEEFWSCSDIAIASGACILYGFREGRRGLASYCLVAWRQMVQKTSSPIFGRPCMWRWRVFGWILLFCLPACISSNVYCTSEVVPVP